jgi:hypothetical protein
MKMIGPPGKGGPKVSVENQSNNTLSCYTTPSAASTGYFRLKRRGQARAPARAFMQRALAGAPELMATRFGLVGRVFPQSAQLSAGATAAAQDKQRDWLAALADRVRGAA